MSYPPETSRSCHEADGRSDRSGGSGGAAGSSSGGVYGTLCGTCVGGTKVPAYTSTSYDVCNDPITSSHHNRIVSNWKKWSLGLDYLLQDSDGVALFKSYLQYEGCSNLLDFWFACQGFRSKVDSSDHRKITQLIKAIYRTYIRGSTCNTTIGLSTMLTESPVLMQPRAEPIRLRAETRKMIAERIARKYALDQTVFDPAQAEVEHFLRTTAYPAFLKSDVYVDFLQATLEGTNRGLHPSRLGCTEPQPMNAILGIPDYSGNFPLGGNILPTLEEDKELKSEEFSSRANPLGIGTPGAYNSDPNRVPSFPSSQRAYPLNCPHCSQYHFQGHQLTCPSSDGCNQQTNYPPPRISSYGFRPTLGIMPSNAPAPLTMENLQMTRLYRTELSLQQSFPYTPMTSGDPTSILNPRPQLTEGYLVGSRGYPYIRNCEPKTGGPRPHMNYVYTQWVDAIRPTLAHSADHMLATRIPTQPPNPYHISYAPASARDSEHHSLSSEARTDDTHSHTDSSQYVFPFSTLQTAMWC
ncbi:unnamed protein product [Dicrocoelium dendriticum]|nr:unnamed protein product [Dicrocoelium dendriticum]